MNNNNFVQLGSFIKHHGLNGELKVFLYNENSETLVPGISIWFKNGEEFIPYELESIRGSKHNLLVKLKNINSRESSQFLIKKEIYVSRSDFPDLKCSPITLLILSLDNKVAPLGTSHTSS